MRSLWLGSKSVKLAGILVMSYFSRNATHHHNPDVSGLHTPR